MRPLSLAAVLIALAACDPTPTPVVRQIYQGQPPLGAALTAEEAPPGEWSWVPFPDTTCGDGSATGLGVNPGDGPDLLVFFDGGGACWDYVGCFTLGSAFDDAYGAGEFATEVAQWFPGSITDRAMLPPSLAGATMVFVPYCTGDVHGGDRVATYHGITGAETWAHLGHANVMAFLARLGATWPSPRKLVVAGSSAGGFGALANYEAFRWYWPDAQGYLVDDSGPPLVGGDLPATLRDAWYGAWNLGASLDAFCVGCREDFSQAISELSRGHRGDRIAFLSHDQDAVMSAFLGGKTPGAFQSAVGRVATDVFAPTRNARVFYDSGYDHMLLLDVGNQTTGAVTLSAWLEQMVSDDPGWASVVP